MSHVLPKGWALAKLRQIATINPRHPRGLDDSMPVSFAPMAALRENKPDFEFLEERPLGEVRRGFTHFAEGDVLFAKITPCMENGKGAVARGLRNGLGCGTTELHVIRPLDGISPDYIYRFLAQPSVRQAAKDNFTGSAGQARVPSAFIEELEIPLAPTDEQRRIVAKLEVMLSKIDRCKDRLAKIPALLRRFRQSVLAAACSGRLTADWREGQGDIEPATTLVAKIEAARREKARPTADINTRMRTAEPRTVHALRGPELPDSPVPETWMWVRFGSVIAELRNGVSLRPNMEPPGTPILRISSVRPGSVDLSEVRYLPRGQDFLPVYALHDDDLLFTRYNGSLDLLGICGMVRGVGQKRFLYPDKLMRVRFDHTFILPAYAEIFFQAPEVHERVIAHAKSSAGQNGVSGTDIKAQPFALPPLAEQKEIARRVSALFALADQLEGRLSKAQQQVESFIPSLLATAFRGKLVTTEAELAAADRRSFESADQLLAKIRCREQREREEANMPTRSRVPRWRLKWRGRWAISP